MRKDKLMKIAARLWCRLFHWRWADDLFPEEPTLVFICHHCEREKEVKKWRITRRAPEA